MGEPSLARHPLTHRDAGAAFVLESKGTWWHAGSHLTTAIVGPTILTLPFAFRGMGWGLGLMSLTVVAVVTFYAYFLMSKVLDHCEREGRRHIRFRKLAADVLGLSKNAPKKDYSLDPSYLNRTFNAFTSLSILASVFGNGILPEIQATLAPPAAGKMVKGLLMCYSVIFLNFYSASVAGYWAFGNEVSSNIFKSLSPDDGPALAPDWLLGLAVIFVLLQLLAIGQVYSQVAYEMMEKQSADVNQGKFSRRNVLPRFILRSVYMIFCAFVAAMLPFFGDITAVVGAVGFIPLDFVLPMLLYNMAVRPPQRSSIYWLNILIMVVFTSVGLLGAFSSIRKLVLDANKFKLFSNDVVV